MTANALSDLLLPAKNVLRLNVAVGLVTNNQDPDGLGRVRVKYPWLGDNDESYWARLVVPMAGKDRGTWFLPEVDDEVLVAFEQGSIDHPYVLGALWNGIDTPPDANEDGKNNHRTIKSRSGHILRFDDTEGAEKIEVIDKSGKNRITINTADNSLSLEASGDITLKAQGKIKLSGAGIEIASDADASFKANANLEVNASAQLNLKGSLVNLN